jgi:GntP family gluconate:H+ symporter
MNPIWLLVIGMVVVVGGVLVLRLHAFLALVLGTLVVAMLTPTQAVYRHALRGAMMPAAAADPGSQGNTFTIDTGNKTLVVGQPLLLGTPHIDDFGYANLRVIAARKGHATAELLEAGTLGLKSDLRTGAFAVEPHQEATARKSAGVSLGDRLAEGFGKTALAIGILIALASIVGEALLVSGGAERIVDSSRRAFGDSRIALAFLVSGFVLGIPVFFDTVFYLLIPLGKVMRIRSGRDYTLYVLCIVAGATMTHSLVPPTPGPLFVAQSLNVKLSTMILVGLVVAIFTAIAGYAYASWINRRVDVPLRESAGLSPAEVDAVLNRDPRSLPSLWLALLPIFLPVALISAAAFAPSPSGGAYATAYAFLQQLGDKNLSMAIAATIALLMAARRRDENGKSLAGKSVGEALASAGVIILITSAGGAFGAVLQQTDIAAAIKEGLPVSKLALLPLVFLVTLTIRMAQGSATVAMVTAAGIAAPLAAAGGLGYHPVYLALAIGAGSKPGMWMNDSGFWIIGKMSGFTEGETLRTATVMMSIMGFVGLAVLMLGAWLVPMVG